MNNESTGFEGWAIVEIMGHRRLAGFCTEANVSGTGLLRIDVYAGQKTIPEFTQFYGGSSVFCLSPTTEVVCRSLMAAGYSRPIQAYELPAPEITNRAQHCGRCGETHTPEDSCSGDELRDSADNNDDELDGL